MPPRDEDESGLYVLTSYIKQMYGVNMYLVSINYYKIKLKTKHHASAIVG